MVLGLEGSAVFNDDLVSAKASMPSYNAFEGAIPEKYADFKKDPEARKVSPSAPKSRG